MMKKDQLLRELEIFFDRYNCNVRIIPYDDRKGEIKLFTKLGTYEIKNGKLFYRGIGPVGFKKGWIEIEITEKGIKYLKTEVAT